MSFKQYRTIDLVLFMVIYGICEYGIIRAGQVMIDQPYIVSLMLPMLLIVMMRWSKQSIYQAIVSAVLFVLYQKGDIKQMVVYILGNLGCMLLLLLVKKIGKDKIRDSAFDSMVYVLAGFILIEVFRYLGILLIYHSGIAALVNLLATDALTLVFSIIVILIARKIDGLFIDQKAYLLNLQKEKETENPVSDDI